MRLLTELQFCPTSSKNPRSFERGFFCYRGPREAARLLGVICVRIVRKANSGTTSFAWNTQHRLAEG